MLLGSILGRRGTGLSTLHDEIRALARVSERLELEGKFLEAVAADPGDLDFFLEIGAQLISTGRKTEAGTLLSMVVDHYQEKGTIDEKVRLFSFLAEAQEKERAHRLALCDALRLKHADQPAYEVFLESCGVKGREPLKDCMEKLEQMSQFDLGQFVFHRKGWGVGRVDDVDTMASELILTFQGGRKHSLPVQSALDILETIPGTDWRARAAFDQEAYLAEAKSDPGKIVSEVLEQVGRSLDTKTFKDLMVDRLIPAGQWSKWWTSARKAAMKRSDVIQEGKSNRLVRIDPADADPFSEMRTVITAGQVLDLANSYLRSHPDVTADAVQELLMALVEGAAKHAAVGDPAPLELMLMADDLAEQFELDRTPLVEALKSRLAHDGEVKRLAWMKSLRLARRALPLVKAAREDKFGDALLQLAPACRGQFLEAVVDEALAAGLEESLRALFTAVMEWPERTPELLVWARRRRTYERYDGLLGQLDAKVLLKRALFLGEAHGKKVEPEHRRLARGVAMELVANKGREFRAFLDTLSTDDLRAWRRQIMGLRGLTEKTHTSLLAMFPFEARNDPDVEEERVSYDESIIYTSKDGLRRRQDEYDRLVNIKLPKVFAAIGKAASHGDLSENAEYTAALEERAALTRKAEEIKNELKAARLMDATVLMDGVVTVGTKVKFHDLDENQEETLTLLGPWEANYDEGILDYRAPLSRALIGHEAEEEVSLEIGGRLRNLKILAIEPVL